MMFTDRRHVSGLVNRNIRPMSQKAYKDELLTNENARNSALARLLVQVLLNFCAILAFVKPVPTMIRCSLALAAVW